MSEKAKVQINWKNVAKLALILFIITAISALLLALTNYVTKDAIAQQTEQKNIQARQQVLPEASSFKEVEDIENYTKETGDQAGTVVEVYGGYKDENLVGYTVKTTPQGFGGPVEILTGISTEGKVTGVTILSHEETPGLGARSIEPEFQEQFRDLDANSEVTVIKNAEPSGNQIQAITGATITSKAVTLGVNTSNTVFKAIVGGDK